MIAGGFTAFPTSPVDGELINGPLGRKFEFSKTFKLDKPANSGFGSACSPPPLTSGIGSSIKACELTVLYSADQPTKIPTD